MSEVLTGIHGHRQGLLDGSFLLLSGYMHPPPPAPPPAPPRPAPPRLAWGHTPITCRIRAIPAGSATVMPCTSLHSTSLMT
jgi:hypothetical protein